MHRLIQVDDSIGMYDNCFFGKELQFYKNHQSEVKENKLPPRLQIVPRSN
jgi:hypothetical protein